MPFGGGPIGGGPFGDNTLNGQQDLIGFSATATLGVLTPEVDASIALSGFSAVTSLGTLTTEIDAAPVLVGFESSAQLGILTPEIDTSTALSGFSATASLGLLAVDIEEFEDLVGFEVTAGLGVLGTIIEATPQLNSLPVLICSLGVLDITSEPGVIYLTGFETASTLGILDSRVIAGQLLATTTLTRLLTATTEIN